MSKAKPEFEARGEIFKPKFKHDAPIDERAPLSFLLGLRWQLGEWGHGKNIIKIEDEALTLKYNGKGVVQASVKKDKLDIKWIDKEWEEWKELQESKEMTIMVERSTNDLTEPRREKRRREGKTAWPNGMILQRSRT